MDFPLTRPETLRAGFDTWNTIGLTRAEKLFAEVERAKDSGRHRAAMKGLAEFPKEFVPKDIDLKV